MLHLATSLTRTMTEFKTSNRLFNLLSYNKSLAPKVCFLGQKNKIVKMLALFLLVPTAMSCSADTTPKYTLGDRGPGMGTIFYVADKPFPCGFELKEYCSVLEVAPAGWYNGEKDPVATMSLVPFKYSQYMQDSSATEPIGAGRHNTLVLASDANTPASAVDIASQYSGGGLRDWYLPSLQEIVLLRESQSSSSGFLPDTYWSSSEYDAYGTVIWTAHMYNPASQEYGSPDFINPTPVAKVKRGYVRPIRAF